jgi:hypothetical protein
LTSSYLITGRVVPERKAFGHEDFRLRIKHPGDPGVDAWVLVGVIDNQIIAKVIGDIGDQSNAALKRFVTDAEQMVLNAVAFTSGAVFDVDITGVVNESKGRADGSFEFHYVDSVHDVVANRNRRLSLQEIWDLCISSDGIPLRLCLNDLHTALKRLDASPFYCYRVIESIKNHIGFRFGLAEKGDKAQWEVMRHELDVEEEKIRYIKSFADPLRHGHPPQPMTGAEWRKIILLSWDVAEAYMLFLSQIAGGERRWPQ